MSDKASEIIRIQKVINVDCIINNQTQYGAKLKHHHISDTCDVLMVNQIYPFKIQGYFLNG